MLFGGKNSRFYVNLTMKKILKNYINFYRDRSGKGGKLVIEVDEANFFPFWAFSPIFHR